MIDISKNPQEIIENVADSQENPCKSEENQKIHSRLEKIGIQKTIFGEEIALTQFKNLSQKRELKEKIKKMLGVQWKD